MAEWVKTSSTSLRLQEIMNRKQLKQADLARMTGISRGAISNYEPKSDVISKFAKSLNCSEMWLWGYDVPMERASTTATNTIEVTEDEQKLLDLFRLVPENQQQMVLQMIEIALNTNK